MAIQVSPQSTVLLIGDSITDAGRDRENELDLGRGYAFLTATLFTQRNPEHGVRFYNRGISGNRVRALQERWDSDCLALAPDVVSIMIGVNDTWRRYDKNDPTTAEDFEAGYRDILDRTKERLDAQFLLIEPFLTPVRDEQYTWREDLDPKISVVRRLATEYGATLLAADGIMAQAAARTRADQWAHDGVHPTPAGHALLAENWLSLVVAAPAKA